MATRDKREVRMSSLFNFYNLYKNQLVTIDIAKANVSFNGHMLFTSELDSFAEKYPSVDMADFTKFLDETGGIKKSGKKPVEGGKKGTNTRLNTVEGAAERGVLPESHQQYVDLVNSVYETCRQINLLMGKENNIKARCSFAIPVEHPKAETETTATENVPA